MKLSITRQPPAPSFFLLGGGGLYSAGYSWLCAQKSLLAGTGGPYEMPEFEPPSAPIGCVPCHCAISPACPLVTAAARGQLAKGFYKAQGKCTRGPSAGLLLLDGCCRSAGEIGSWTLLLQLLFPYLTPCPVPTLALSPLSWLRALALSFRLLASLLCLSLN